MKRNYHHRNGGVGGGGGGGRWGRLRRGLGGIYVTIDAIQVQIATILPPGSVMRTGTVRGTPGRTHVCHYPDLGWKMVDRNANRASRQQFLRND